MTPFHGLSFRRAIVAIPVIGPMAKRIYRTMTLPAPPALPFTSSTQYWEDRYAFGGNSGAGSHGRLARFKANVINQFVAGHAIQTVVEFGCGDGAQLKLARYPQYTGFDVSSRAVELCRTRFRRETSKQFFHAVSPEADTIKADLAMSLDVIYHLVEDEVYDRYMSRLVMTAKKFVCIYSSNVERPSHVTYIRHRRFTDWLTARAPQWKPILKVPNRFPEDPERPNDTSWADFYFFAA
jgi:SAM-dependent methyltransferase